MVDVVKRAESPEFTEADLGLFQKGPYSSEEVTTAVSGGLSGSSTRRNVALVVSALALIAIGLATGGAAAGIGLAGAAIWQIATLSAVAGVAGTSGIGLSVLALKKRKRFEIEED